MNSASRSPFPTQTSCFNESQVGDKITTKMSEILVKILSLSIDHLRQSVFAYKKNYTRIFIIQFLYIFILFYTFLYITSTYIPVILLLKFLPYYLLYFKLIFFLFSLFKRMKRKKINETRSLYLSTYLVWYFWEIFL